MAELTNTDFAPQIVIGTKAGPKDCKLPSEEDTGTSSQIPLIYVRYKDHLIYKNLQKPESKAVERETVGWLTNQNEEIMLIEHDHTAASFNLASNRGNGIIILKSCVLEIRLLLLRNSKLNLNSPESKGKLSLRLRQRSEKLDLPEK
jgi:hypothetical protein